jgi:hypothetical protein
MLSCTLEPRSFEFISSLIAYFQHHMRKALLVVPLQKGKLELREARIRLKATQLVRNRAGTPQSVLSNLCMDGA